MPSLLPILFLFILCCYSHQLQPNSLSPGDTAALLDIRRTLRDLQGSAFFSSWNFSTNPCTSFAGILCSSDDNATEFLRVSSLTLGTGLADSLGLTGTLPVSIANLTTLTDLIVNPGRISGPIPPSIPAQCRRLRFVSITDNLVSGSIPTAFADLPDLHTLHLGHNRLSGPIPPPLPNLKVLVLAANSLSGPLRMSISTTTLLHLDIHQNSLSGPLPPLPPTLLYLSAAANSLSGPIDPAFTSPMPELAFLDLSMNQFSGTIPSSIFALPRLSTILLHRNNFSGTLSVSMLVAPPWLIVDLSHNMISGAVPAPLASSESLFLNSNRFTGPVPEEYVRRVYSGSTNTKNSPVQSSPIQSNLV